MKHRIFKGVVLTSLAALLSTASFAQSANGPEKDKKAKDAATHVDYKSPPAPETQSRAANAQSSSGKTKTKKNKIPADNHPKREMPF